MADTLRERLDEAMARVGGYGSVLVQPLHDAVLAFVRAERRRFAERVTANLNDQWTGEHPMVAEAIAAAEAEDA